MRSLFQVASFLALSAVASAQAELVFTINQAQSNFSWSGTSTLGAIVGNPSTTFQLTGTSKMSIYPLGGDPIDAADFPGGGDAAAVPDLHGKINNVLPFLPPLATIDITNLHLDLSASPFFVAPTGAFAALITVTALSGNMTVTPLTGSTTVTDLTGQASTPQLQSGTLVQTGTTLNLTLPVNTTFAFSDPSSGASGSITIVGTMRAAWDCPTPTTYCTAKTNSLGCVPAIQAVGTASWTMAAPFTISAINELNQKAGLLYYGYAASNAPFQGGIKCVASPTLRLAVQNSGGNTLVDDCSGMYSYEFNSVIQAHNDPSLLPGAEVFAQMWSRDPGVTSTTNLTNALRFTICP